MAVPASSLRTDGGGGGATAAASFSPIISTLVPASAIVVFIALSASFPTLLSYYATLAVSLVFFARAVWPRRVDAALARARADLERDLRSLRAHAATAPVFAPVGRARSSAAAARWWDEYRDARFVLRVLALGVRLATTVLFDAARDEARAWAPSVLGYLRGVVDRIRIIRSPSPCTEGEDDEGFVLKDVVCLVGAAFYVLFTLHLLFFSSSAAATTGIQFCAVCFAATCGLTMVLADWIDPPDDDETDTASTDEDSPTKGGEASYRDEELEVRESWRFLWVLILVTHCVDALLLRVTLSAKPATLTVLALCNFEVLKVGRQVQLTTAPEDDDDGGGDDGALVDRWRRGAMVVYAACSVKVFVIYVVLDCYMAALGFLWLFVMADLLLAEEDNLSVFDASPGQEGEEDVEDGEETADGFEGNITGGAEGEVDEEEASREEHSSKSTLEDEEHSNTSTLGDEEESYAHCDTSSEDEEESSEEHEIVDEGQRQEETDCGSDGSTDDGWDLVDVDPEMPAKANRGASHRNSRVFPWNHAA